MRPLALAAVTATLWAWASLSGQQPLFRRSVEAMTVDVRVTDSTGAFVRGLTAADFRLYEDDVEHDVLTFSLVDIPFVAPTASTLFGDIVPRDVFTNHDLPSGRLYVLVLDDATSPPSWTTSIRTVARRFIETHFAVNDVMAIVPTSGREAVMTGFTSSRRVLLGAVDRFDAGFGAARIGSGSTMELLSRQILRAVPAGPRHKSLIFVSGATATWAAEEPGVAEREPAPALRSVITAAARANLSVYTIDPSGNPSRRPQTIAPAPAVGVAAAGADDVATSSAAADRLQPDPGPSLVARWQGSSEFAHLADATGGFSVANSNDFVGAFDRILAENSTHYLLSYASNNRAHDGRFRRIRVDVNRPGVIVKARTGYFALTAEPPQPTGQPDMPPQLTAMLRSAFPVQGLTLQAAAPVFRGTGDEAFADVIVEARGADLLFVEDGQAFHGTLRVAIAALDRVGVVTGERGDLSMKLGDGARRQVVAGGVRLLSRLTLKPGTYQLRIGATDGDTGAKFGSVQDVVTVPDFSRGAVTLSSIAMRAADADALLTRGTVSSWSGRLSGLPALRREFTAADRLETYMEVYDNRGVAGRTITVSMVVQRTTGEVVLTREQIIGAEDTTAKWFRYPLRLSVPAGELGPGDYVLTISATHSADPQQRPRQQVPFSVR